MQQLKICITSLAFLFCTMSLMAQKITAHKEFHSTKAQPIINVEDDLYLRFDLGRSLEAIITERSREGFENIYGILKIDFDGAEFSTDPFLVGFSGTASMQEFDLALSIVMKEFHALAIENKDNWGEKDELLAYALSQDNNPLNIWMRAIAARALPEQTHKVKASLYLMDNARASYENFPAVATGSFDVKVAKDVLLPLYGTKIPALYRPVVDHGIVDDLHKKNVGNILWSTELIPSKKATIKLLQSSFNITEKAVYGRIYLPKSIRNLSAGVGESKSCNYKVQYYLDQKLVASSDVTLEATICQKETSLPIVLWSTEEEDSGVLKKHLESLKAGVHELKVVVNLDYKDGQKVRTLPLASSNIKLVK